MANPAAAVNGGCQNLHSPFVWCHSLENANLFFRLPQRRCYHSNKYGWSGIHAYDEYKPEETQPGQARFTQVYQHPITLSEKTQLISFGRRGRVATECISHRRSLRRDANGRWQSSGLPDGLHKQTCLVRFPKGKWNKKRRFLEFPWLLRHEQVPYIGNLKKHNKPFGRISYPQDIVDTGQGPNQASHTFRPKNFWPQQEQNWVK